MADVYFQTALKKKRRKEEYEDDIRGEPVWLLTLEKALEEGMAGNPEQKAADYERDGVGNAKPRGEHADERGGDQQPDQKLDCGMGCHDRIQKSKGKEPIIRHSVTAWN
jgi:hypothetical protein